MATTSIASLNALSMNFGWSQLPPNSTVVDMGGSQGRVSIHLARKFTHIHCIVQDLPEVVEGAAEKLPEDVRGRIQFVSHDLFTEQSVRMAEGYLLRYVLHDWKDRYCVQMLRNLVSCLKAGAKVVIQDHLLPEPGTMILLQGNADAVSGPTPQICMLGILK